jgi:hypothetical protein
MGGNKEEKEEEEERKKEEKKKRRKIKRLTAFLLIFGILLHTNKIISGRTFFC